MAVMIVTKVLVLRHNYTDYHNIVYRTCHLNQTRYRSNVNLNVSPRRNRIKRNVFLPTPFAYACYMVHI